ncbi:TRAM domain-containing protein [Natronomonas salina]|uniref:TRAM domain-containing protein n=1 Tax=Natronomonas salina TaxID=1710540 RepID=UPI0015B73FFF|nr:TRAM domain-containing protein [Natronomonas salina]QLD88670.1 TRAM domain-containing protein [Natronomonas salina]
MGSTSTAPVESGETHHVEIEELGEEGDGIAYVEGFVVFVPDTELTEAVDVEIESVRDSFAVGEVVERHE